MRLPVPGPVPSPDEENPEWKSRDFERARPAEEVLPPEILAQFKAPRQRGPQKAPKKVATSIRLNPRSLEHFKKSGPGWQSRLDAFLLRAIEREEQEGEEARTRA